MKNANSTTSAKRLEAQERLNQAASFRIGGMSYQEIAENLGVTKQAVHGMLKRYYAGLSKEVESNVIRLREVETARLDRAQVALWPTILKKGADFGEVVAAINAFIKISKRRAALWGMDTAPASVPALAALIHQLPPDSTARLAKGEPLDVVLADLLVQLLAEREKRPGAAAE